MWPRIELWDSTTEGAPAGGAPATAAEPVAAPIGGAGDIPAPDQGVNWEELADGSLDETPPGDEDVEDPPEVTPEPSPTPVPTPTATPAPAASPAQSPTPTPAPTPAPTAEEQARAAAEARGRMRDELAGIYSGELDEDTKSALLADPASVMPKLLAQAAMDGANLALRHMHEILPQYVSRVTETREGANKAWTDFDKAHGDLAKPEYRRTIQTAIQALKASGQPIPDQKAAMDAVARTARAMLGLPQPGAAPAPAPNPTAAPVAPHTPVARGRARPSAPAKAQDNPWVDLLD